MFVESIFSLLMLQNDNEKLRNVQYIELHNAHVCVYSACSQCPAGVSV